MRQVHATVVALVCSVAAASGAAAQTMMTVAASATPAAVRATAPEPARKILDGAVKKAKAEHKSVLVYFTASWCGWCHQFDKFVHSPEVGKLMGDNFVLIPLVAMDSAQLNNPGSDSLMAEMGIPSNSLPSFFMLDGDGKKLATSMVMQPGGTNMGHPGTPEEVKAFGELLEKTAPKMTAAERKQVTDYLDKLAGR